MIDTKRNYGVDLLRVVSMIMVPILHVLGHGGILNNAQVLLPSYEMAYLLETLAYCATNCYALISGYVGYTSKFRYSKIFLLYLQVAFYTVISTAAVCFIDPGFLTAKNIIYAVFPIANNTYWYFTSYFCMFFFIPFFNTAVEKAPRAVLGKLILTLFCVFSILPAIFRYDIATLANGYSALWLGVLYIMGAYIKKYDIGGSLKKSTKLTGYLVCVVLTWAVKFIVEFIGRGETLMGISYTSPTIVLCAVFLLMYFAKLKPGRFWTGFAKFFAPVSFGVYLIHENPAVKGAFIENRFTGYLKFNPVVMAALVIATAIVIWFVCSLIDRVRFELFRLLKVGRLCSKAEEKTKSAVLRLNGRVKNSRA
ncbi:MAG: acyltransferase [Clostridia bacterium]|nr:acyltransferase [Clostridia bacterium]